MNRSVMLLLLGISLMMMSLGCNGNKRRPEVKRNGEIIGPVGGLNSQVIDSTQTSFVGSLNVYLENSGSMNGYVKGNTGFEQSIYYYLSQIEYTEVVDSIHLYYINSKVIPQNCELESFIHHIEPDDFRKKGGNLGASDIAVMLDTVLSRQQSNEISLFISDCIFSPGKKMPETEIQNYLIEQSTRIERIFSNKLKFMNNELAVVICQLQSDFNGTFFNREDAYRQIQHKRPFYFWLIGSPMQICQLMNVIPFERLKEKGAEVENVYTLCRINTPVKYGIEQNRGKIGSFERDRKNPRKSIFNCKPGTRGQQQGIFRFAIGVDYSMLPLDSTVLLNPLNYDLSAKEYSVEIRPIYTLQGYTHSIYVSTTQLPISATELEITLKNPIPQWVEEKNDSIGLELEQGEALDRTFGLKALVEGVYNAFGGRQTECAKFVVLINKN